MRQLGAVTDPLGRSAVGLAVTFDSADGRGKIQRALLFDQKTGKVLGSRDIQLEPGPKSQKWQAPGRMLSYRAVLDAGWSNTKPAPPVEQGHLRRPLSWAPPSTITWWRSCFRYRRFPRAGECPC
ncbi:hypothetical protein [Nonomuraea mesophila]|uniref:hypothetical protein n=1 Tax=Nonomuraea mesophila TaxID=2530382 RepID=UPI00104DD1A5|nr:hypothetical protein [Nonomuraea mesophila]